MTNVDSGPRRGGEVFLYAASLLALGLTVIPFVWMLLSSVKPEAEILVFPPKWLPSSVTWDHFRELFVRLNIWTNLMNSLIVAVSITLATIVVNAMAGFAFAKYRFPGREALFTVLLATMMIPGQVTMMPVFLLLKSMGLLNTYIGLILPGTASVFAIFLMRQFMMSLPDSVLEAARIDGCSEWRLFYQIVLPLAMPAVATLTIFTFMAAWNEFLWALIVMLDADMYTLPVALATLSGQQETSTKWGVLMAGSVVTILPVLLVFLAVQKQYIRGISMTGTKG